ncbi:enoyl-CoA hydratase [Paxillus involutus ATCC 200175]|uniref:Probable enoyl-CoA hydratase, mitochondrial n=1 Tax=Paxillus involutus ATCC 200175 TaxID=664439 RepID=A0A0C9TBK4_PAXIN|nr:enoyl-CoA hydratase [Paxillus involutus ATCC 200175]
MESEPTVLTREEGNVGIITLNRPKALNALNATLIDELLAALRSYDRSSDIGAIVMTGNNKAFCAGADIREQKELDFVRAYNTDYLKNLNDGIVAIHKPVIGAINGYALGGGCELAMMCDILYAGRGAVFGQPEIKLGTIPGAGGTQRLIRAIGKSKAMDMILTGGTMKSAEAEAAGLVAKIFDDEETVTRAIETAQKIASFSAPVVAMAKEAVNEAEELGLKNGLHFESRLYHSSFGLADHVEGFEAFLQKREPRWTHK